MSQFKEKRRKSRTMTVVQHEWHGSSNSFTSSMAYQFQDNSLSKFEELQKLQHIHEKNILKRQQTVRKNKARQSKLSIRYSLMERNLEQANSQLHDLRQLERLMEKSSLKIQKVFKGYITRKKLEHV